MKILIFSYHGEAYDGLARLTAPNKWRYSARHGYDLITLRMENGHLFYPKRVIELLPIYDAIIAIGTDVVFTNMGIRFEDLIQEDDGLVIASEHLASNFPFNNDVAIWKNGPKAFAMLNAIINAEEEWMKMKWIWQEWLNVRWEMIRDWIRIVPAKTMNSCHQEGLGKWAPGDFVYHAMDMDLKSKIATCEYYLQCVKE